MPDSRDNQNISGGKLNRPNLDEIASKLAEIAGSGDGSGKD